MARNANDTNIWKGKSFPVKRDGVTLLRLPDGRVLQDACIWEGFIQEDLGIDPVEFWETIHAYPRWGLFPSESKGMMFIGSKGDIRY